MPGPLCKPIYWVGSSLKDLREFPEDPRYDVGVALRVAQQGGKHPNAKPLKGFGSADVLEIVTNDEGGTYRGVYTVRFSGTIYVLDAFQKKSKIGIETPKADIDRIKGRLKQAEALDAEAKSEARSGKRKH